MNLLKKFTEYYNKKYPEADQDDIEYFYEFLTAEYQDFLSENNYKDDRHPPIGPDDPEKRHWDNLATWNERFSYD
jgi:hypothetical protein